MEGSYNLRKRFVVDDFRVIVAAARMRSEGVSVRSISATTSKSKPRKRYQRFIATRQREKNWRFSKCSVQKLWCHLLTLSAFGGLVGLFSSS